MRSRATAGCVFPVRRHEDGGRKAELKAAWHSHSARTGLGGQAFRFSRWGAVRGLQQGVDVMWHPLPRRRRGFLPRAIHDADTLRSPQLVGSCGGRKLLAERAAQVATVSGSKSPGNSCSTALQSFPRPPRNHECCRQLPQSERGRLRWLRLRAIHREPASRREQAEGLAPPPVFGFDSFRA